MDTTHLIGAIAAPYILPAESTERHHAIAQGGLFQAHYLHTTQLAIPCELMEALLENGEDLRDPFTTIYRLWILMRNPRALYLDDKRSLNYEEMAAPSVLALRLDGGSIPVSDILIVAVIGLLMIVAELLQVDKKKLSIFKGLVEGYAISNRTKVFSRDIANAANRRAAAVLAGDEDTVRELDQFIVAILNAGRVHEINYARKVVTLLPRVADVVQNLSLLNSREAPEKGMVYHSEPLEDD